MRNPHSASLMLAAAPRARVNTYRRHETPDIASDVLSSGLFGAVPENNLSGGAEAAALSAAAALTG